MSIPTYKDFAKELIDEFRTKEIVLKVITRMLGEWDNDIDSRYAYKRCDFLLLTEQYIKDAF